MKIINNKKREGVSLIFLCGALLFAVIACIKRFGFTPEGYLALIMLVVLCKITAVDMDEMRIPNELNLMILLGGVAAAFLIPEISLRERLIGILLISFPMLLITLVVKGAFGGGDIKLCAACGMALGWKGVLVGSIIGIILGGIFGAYLLIRKKASLRNHFALGPFLAFGFIFVMFV